MIHLDPFTLRWAADQAIDRAERDEKSGFRDLGAVRRSEARAMRALATRIENEREKIDRQMRKL